jgi:hypothetical protein
MKHKALLFRYLFFLLACARATGQGVLFFDQQSSTNEIPNPFLGTVIQQFAPLGQSFTPTLTSIGFVRLKLYDGNSGNGIGATLVVNLRSNAITGSILAQTISVTLTDGFAEVVSFVFPMPVTLTPGTNYFFEPVVQSGDSWKVDLGPYNYPGGTTISQGLSIPGSDLWFREGIIVPEPSSALLIVIGATVLVRQFRKRQRP